MPRSFAAMRQGIFPDRIWIREFEFPDPLWNFAVLNSREFSGKQCNLGPPSALSEHRSCLEIVKFPVFSRHYKEIYSRDWFAADCLIRHAVFDVEYSLRVRSKSVHIVGSQRLVAPGFRLTRGASYVRSGGRSAIVTANGAAA